MFYLHKAKIVGISALIAIMLYFSGFLIILTPLPLLYASIARGRIAGWLSFGIAALAVVAVYVLFPGTAAPAISPLLAHIPIPGQGISEFMPPVFFKVFGIGYFAFFAAVGLVLALGIHNRSSLINMGTKALLAGLGVLIFSLFLAKLGGAAYLADSARSYLQQILNEIVLANQTAGSQNAQLTFMADHAEQLVTTVLRLLPSLVFVYAVITVAINAVIGRKIAKAHYPASHAGDIIRFRLPDSLIWTLIITGFMYFADNYALRSKTLGIVALNLLVGLGTLYFLQGMAVTVYFVQKIRLSLIRTVAYITMIIFLQTVSIVLVLLGIADVWANFRLRRWRLAQGQSE
jgi:uncharacterized protein YybS (DUF2232 family)